MDTHKKCRVLVLALSAGVILLHCLGLLTTLVLTAAAVAGSLAALSLFVEGHKLHQHLRRAGEWLRKEVDGL